VVQVSEGGDSKTAEQCAAAKGLRVAYPESDELFIDIDTVSDLEAFYRTLPALGHLVLSHRKIASPSGKHGRWHIICKWHRPFESAKERILIQALLGSDRLHEALSWLAAERGGERVTCRFYRDAGTAEPKEEGPLDGL
jgi:hypothetical protein